MVKLNKKGQHMLTVVLIISVLVLILWLVFLKLYGSFAEKSAEGNACLLSIVAAASLKLPFIGTIADIDLNCPIEDIESDAKTKDAVNLELASAMTECWVNYGQGKIDYYDSWEWGSATTHCRICSKINFNADAKAPTYAEFGNYLSSTKLPGQRKTFAEFFTGADNAKILLGGEGSSTSQLIDLTQPNYVVFRVEKHNQELQDVKDAFTAAEVVDESAAGAGILVGGQQLQQFMQQAPNAFTKEAYAEFGMKVVGKKGKILYGPIAKKSLEAGTATLVSTGTKGTAKKVAGTALKAGSKVVPVFLKKIGGKAIPVVGWGLLVYDVATLAGKADQFNPSLAVYNIKDIQGICEDLS